jgi:hypothetical protein
LPYWKQVLSFHLEVAAWEVTVIQESGGGGGLLAAEISTVAARKNTIIM